MTLKKIVEHLVQKEKMGCNCDLDRWAPETSTGHSWVCRIHKAAIEVYQGKRKLKEE